MPHNLTITYNRSQISITSTHPHVDLHVHTTTADHQGHRTEAFSLEIGRPTHRQAPAFPTPDHLQPNDHLPIASEATFASRLRVPQQQPPPPLDSYAAIAGRYEPPPRQAARDAPAATYYPPSPSPERDHDYASPNPGVERVHYDYDPGPGRIARHGASHGRYPSPCISITPPTPSPDASRSQGAVVAARPAYCGGEMVLYGYGGGGGGYYDDDGGGCGLARTLMLMLRRAASGRGLGLAGRRHVAIGDVRVWPIRDCDCDCWFVLGWVSCM